MLKKVFRVVLTLCGMLLGYGVSSLLIDRVAPVMHVSVGTGMQIAVTVVFMAIFGIIFFILFKALLRRGQMVVDDVQTSLQAIPANELVAGILGLIIGLVIAFLISQIINEIRLLQTMYLNIILSVLLYLFFGFAGVTLSMRLGREIGKLAPQFPFVSQQAVSQKSSRSVRQKLAPKIFDTSVIIDGRIVDILKTGFLEGDIIIADFVLVELRHLADSADDLKRAKGRRGLDILHRIQEEYGIEIYDTASDRSLEELPEVDLKLLKLAKNKNGAVLTNDYNLNKVAAIEGVKVLNINELANTLKPVVLPGETMQVYLVKEGKENGQGVAYLDDGTMIVVEGGRPHLGKTVSIMVTSVLQTAAGRMIFGKTQ